MLPELTTPVTLTTRLKREQVMERLRHFAGVPSLFSGLSGDDYIGRVTPDGTRLEGAFAPPQPTIFFMLLWVAVVSIACLVSLISLFNQPAEWFHAIPFGALAAAYLGTRVSLWWGKSTEDNLLTDVRSLLATPPEGPVGPVESNVVIRPRHEI